MAPNPPTGAVISYYFKTASKDEVTLDIKRDDKEMSLKVKVEARRHRW